MYYKIEYALQEPRNSSFFHPGTKLNVNITEYTSRIFRTEKHYR